LASLYERIVEEARAAYAEDRNKWDEFHDPDEDDEYRNPELEAKLEEAEKTLNMHMGDEDDETPEERYESLKRILQDAGVPGTLWKITGIFPDHAAVPFVCVPLLGMLSIEILVRMMEMQIDDYLEKRSSPTKAFVIGLRCLASLAIDEDVRNEIIGADGRELVDYTMTSNWAPHCRLELEGARRRLLVESLRVARLDTRSTMSTASEGNVEDKFTLEQLDELRVAFNTFDKDQSGDIDISELGAVMKELGLEPTESQLRDMIRSTELEAGGGTGGDQFSDGKIDWREFLLMMSRSMTSQEQEDEFQKCFSFFDKQNLGYIDVPTFVIALRALGQEFTDEELDLLLQHSKFENDEYDKITYKEFVKMMMAQ
jgi:calmodulin